MKMTVREYEQDNKRDILTFVCMTTVLILCFLIGNFAAYAESTNLRETAAVPEAGCHAENEYMELAIKKAREGICHAHGGPFGSVIVLDGKIVGQGHNMVLKNNDSTCHGEISAIRNAEAVLGTFDLSGAVLYTTGEPCPMCLAACLWASIQTVYYGCTIGTTR